MARVGIDLGTTNTVVGMVYDDGPHVVPRGSGRVMPSVVHFPHGAAPVVGEEADNAGSHVVRSVKRLMGRTHDTAVDEGSEAYFPLAGDVRLVQRGETDAGIAIAGEGGAAQTLWPHEVSALILGEAKRHAERHLGQTVQAIVTVPAYFGDTHRAATLDAAKAAGLELVGDGLLDEPTAAALAFAAVVGFRVGEPVLVVDWGGGTLDVTVIASDGPGWYQCAIDGDLTLGGDDLDRTIARAALKRAGLSEPVMADPANAWALVTQARRVKEMLSERTEAAFACSRLVDPDTAKRLPPVAFTLTRAELEAMLEEQFDAAVDVVARCLEQPDADRASIRKILLAGGTSRMPGFRQRLAALLPEARLHDEVDPMHAVAVGAALYANIRPEISRISPYGYAVVAEDDTRVDVIPPNTGTPTPEGMHFAVPMRTGYEGQTVYRMSVAGYRLHRDGLRIWQEPRRLFARGMPASASGTRVDVELWLDETKDLKACTHLDGHHGSYPLEGRSEGPEELFGRVLDAALDAEALAERNRSQEKGLVTALRDAVEWANVVDRRHDRVDAEAVLARMADLREQVEARQRVDEDASVPAHERERRTVHGWVSFFETSFLPQFRDVIGAEKRDEIERIIAGVRTMLRTGAGPGELWAALNELYTRAFDGELAPAFRAWQKANLLGIPERLSTELRDHARRACAEHKSGDASGLRATLAATVDLLAESEEAFRTWQATSQLHDARPDLEVIDTPPGTVH